MQRMAARWPYCLVTWLNEVFDEFHAFIIMLSLHRYNFLDACYTWCILLAKYLYCFMVCVFYQITSLGETHQVGKISKQWSGLVKEFFTNVDNFGIKCKLTIIPPNDGLLNCQVFCYSTTLNVCMIYNGKNLEVKFWNILSKAFITLKQTGH